MTEAKVTKRADVDFDELVFTHAGVRVVIETKRMDAVRVRVMSAGADREVLANLTIDNEGVFVTDTAKNYRAEVVSPEQEPAA